MAAGKSPPPHGLLAKVSRLGAGPGGGGHASRRGHAPPRPAGDPGLQTPWDLAPARDACTAACSPPSSLPRRGAAVRVSWAPVSTLRPGARKGTGAARLPPAPALPGKPREASPPRRPRGVWVRSSSPRGNTSGTPGTRQAGPARHVRRHVSLCTFRDQPPSTWTAAQSPHGEPAEHTSVSPRPSAPRLTPSRP